MNSYYEVLYKDDQAFGVAYAPENTDLFLVPNSGQAVKSWETIRLTLREGIYTDYPANDLGGRLCSEKLKTIIEENRSKNDVLQWLKAIVADAKGEERDYYILHFPVEHDVLDKKKTIFADGDFVVKAVISLEAAKNHEVFTHPTGGRITLIVSGRVKERIESEACIGMVFSLVPISENTDTE